MEFGFTEPVTGLVLADISVTGGSADNLQDLGSNRCSVDVTPTGNGTVTVRLSAGVVQDAVGLMNAAQTIATFTADLDAPTVERLAASGVVLDDFTVTIRASEPIRNLTESDLMVTGSTLLGGSLSGASDTYTVVISPQLGSTVDVTLPAGAVEDLAGNVTIAATSLSRQSGSPQTAFAERLAEIIRLIEAQTLALLNNELSANSAMMTRLTDRFIDSFGNENAAARNIPLDLSGQVTLSASQQSTTNGEIFGQDVTASGVVRTLTGQFDIIEDDELGVSAQISGRLSFEHAPSKDLRVGYYVGANLGRSKIDGSTDDGLTGDADTVGITGGAYALARLPETLFVNGYAGLGYYNTDLSLSDDVLDLTASYDATAYYLGGSVTGDYPLTKGWVFRPNAALDYGQSDTGLIGLRAFAYGQNAGVSQDLGTVSVTDLSVTPEILKPLVFGDVTGNLRLQPQYLCRSTNGAESRDDCGAGMGVAFDGQSGNGLHRFGLSLDALNIGTSTQIGSQLYYELQF